MAEVDSAVPLYDVATMDERLHASTALYRFLLRLLGALGLSGLGLAAVGVYGVVAFGVAQRRREIGLRMALGATHRDILRMTARSGLAPVVAGLVVGGGLSVVLGRALEEIVRGVGTADPLTLATVSGSLLVSSIAAVLVPARRAAAVQPAEALAGE
jgi:ABC-type antimicrobial peptide transport system permease subunit